MRIFIWISFFCLAMSACRGKSGTDDSKGEREEKNPVTPANSNLVTLTEKQIQTIGITLGDIEQKALNNSVKANGALTVPNQNRAFITPLYSGVIRSLLIQPGSSVKQGQVIATLVNPELAKMQQQLQQVNTQIALSQTEVNRQKALVEGNAAPLKKLQQAQAELATLNIERTGLQRQLNSIGAAENFSSTITMRAPISGTVSKLTAQLGSNVDMNTPIAEIINNSQLHLDLFVYETDLPKLKIDQTIHFTLTSNAGREYDAKIFSIGAAFEKASKTVPVHAKVIGDKLGLIDGMSVTALISLDRTLVPSIPTDAIVNFQGNDYVFIVADSSAASHVQGRDARSDRGKGEIVFERIPVVKGKTDVGYSEITLLKPVSSRVKVVTKGAFFVLAKMTNVEEAD